MVCLVSKTCTKCKQKYSADLKAYGTECGKCLLEAAVIGATTAQAEAWNAARHRIIGNEPFAQKIFADACSKVLLEMLLEVVAGDRAGKVGVLKARASYFRRVKAYIEK